MQFSGDGLGDCVETARAVSAFVADSDHDGLDDGAEVLDVGTDPLEIDTDGDGLSDGTEAEAIRMAGSNRRTVKTDPLDADTDGDSLQDGSEVGAVVAPSSNTYYLYSLPTSADSDSDRLGDYVEARLGSDPLNPDTDGDGLQDGEDPAVLVEKQERDTLNARQKADALAHGAIFGEAGLPGDRFADSPYYVVGLFASAFLPGPLGVAAGVRDLAAALEKGRAIDAALEAAGLLPVFNQIEAVREVGDTLRTYAKHFPGEASRAEGLLIDLLYNRVPADVLIGVTSKLDAASGARKFGLSDDALAEWKNYRPDYLDSRVLRDVHEWEDGEFIYLQEGARRVSGGLEQTRKGMSHIIRKHFDGIADEVRGSDEATTFFPIGQKVEELGMESIDDYAGRSLPKAMSREEAKHAVDMAVQKVAKGEGTKMVKKSSGRTTVYEVKTPDVNGIETMEVAVKRGNGNGKGIKGGVQSVYPTKGDALYRWDSENKIFETWDSDTGGWIKSKPSQ